MNKRYGNKWSALGRRQLHDAARLPEQTIPQNPNQPGVEDRTTWNFKASGSYDAPWGIRISPVLRHQSGVNFARTLDHPGAAGAGPDALAGTTAYAEPANANREDNIWVFDVRAEKSLHVRHRASACALYVRCVQPDQQPRVGDDQRARLACSYLKPTAILAPLTARVGFRFIF